MRAGWRGVDLVTAIRVMLGESGGNPRARNVNRNGTVDRGLWQLNSATVPDDAIAFDPERATRAAFALWRRRGWAPWYTLRHKRPDLDRAASAAAGAAVVAAAPPLLGVVALGALFLAVVQERAR